MKIEIRGQQKHITRYNGTFEVHPDELREFLVSWYDKLTDKWWDDEQDQEWEKYGCVEAGDYVIDKID